MTTSPAPIAAAAELMDAFARRTGLAGGEGARRRYLWTDAFAVGNFLELADRTGRSGYRGLAVTLVDRVHEVLGRHRDDDARHGWLSGLDENSGRRHPTAGGLRIGKPLAERRAGERFDERKEWERDGQYFHYLTRWMHALDVVARRTRRPECNVWARELAEVAHRHFVYDGRSPLHRSMHWKMSIDLSRPLVPSMGLHDPLDGYIVGIELQQTAEALAAPAGPDIAHAVREFRAMIREHELATDDPLGIGGILVNAALVAQLLAERDFDGEGLMEALLQAAIEGLGQHEASQDLLAPAETRLAFRELGLAIGLGAVEAVDRAIEEKRLRFSAGARFADGVEALRAFAPVGAQILSFWMAPPNRAAASWRSHQDINDVMLATALIPESCLLPPIGV